MKANARHVLLKIQRSYGQVLFATLAIFTWLVAANFVAATPTRTMFRINGAEIGAVVVSAADEDDGQVEGVRRIISRRTRPVSALASAADGQPSIILSAEPPAEKGHFQMTATDGVLILKTDVPKGFERGLSTFLYEATREGEGAIELNDGFSYRADLNGQVRYREFGAVGDGATHDLNAIVAAHAFANEHELPVRADDEATYHIGAGNATAIVQTNTDFGSAAFIIDDTEVPLSERRSDIFRVRSSQSRYTPKGITALERHQSNIGTTLPTKSLLIVTDPGTKRFIRRGANRNRGSSQTDTILVDQDGNVDPRTPIVWDFKGDLQITAYPVDSEELRISGGRFTTIANNAPSEYTYFHRGIQIKRSNVIVTDLIHLVEGEGEHGAPYRGFIAVQSCSDVRIENSVLTARKTYRTIGAADTTVSMGSYDLNLNRALNVTISNVTQSNDINDGRYWGIMGSNHCKNLTYDNCTLSRFDAHQGVVNATIRNSNLRQITIIGEGTFTIENSRVYGNAFISLRNDYGSTWKGDLKISGCTWVPSGGHGAISLIGGYNDGSHDFGYICYMPTEIHIENLHVEDLNHGSGYEGPTIFSYFNRALHDEEYEPEHPYVTTERVIIDNLTTASEKPFRISDNELMFRDLELINITTD